MKYKKQIWIVLGVIFLVALGVVIQYYLVDDTFVGEEIDFELDTLFLKVALKENSTTISHVKVEEGLEDFSIKVNQIPELVDFGELDLEGKEQEVEIVFNSEGVEPGVYIGELEFSAKGMIKTIPIIMEVQTEKVIFDSNINLYPKGKSLVPGQRLTTDIKVYDLASAGRHNIIMDYFIKDFKGNTIVSETEDMIIDGKLDYSKSLTLPENIRLENYVLIVIVTYVDPIGEKSVGTSSIFFKVAEEGGDEISLNKTIFLIIGIFGFFFIVFIMIFVYSIFHRDKLLNELQNQYRKELANQRALIQGRVKKDIVKLKTPVEKKVYRKEIAKVKKKRIKALRIIHKKRLQRFHKIKKKRIKGNLQGQLKKWKKQGYDTGVLEQKYKLPNVNEIKTKISKWKKQGYDTSVLEKKLK